MCVSMNTQSRSWDSNMFTKVRRNNWGTKTNFVFLISKDFRVVKCWDFQLYWPEFLSKHPHLNQWHNSDVGEDRWDNDPLPWTLQQEGSDRPGTQSSSNYPQTINYLSMGQAFCYTAAQFICFQTKNKWVDQLQDTIKKKVHVLYLQLCTILLY